MTRCRVSGVANGPANWVARRSTSRPERGRGAGRLIIAMPEESRPSRADRRM